MPIVDGWLLCEILSSVRRWKKVPVVLQSALVGAQNIKRGIALGAHSYLEKPYTREGVREVLDALFRQDEVNAQGVPTEMNMVVKEVAEATKQTFNLMLGTQTHVLEITSLQPGSLPSTWDFAGSIPADGMTQIEISAGWSRGLACSAATALMNLEPDELDDDLVLDSLREILNMVLGAAIRTIGKTFPVKLALPAGVQDGAIPYNHDAPYKFRIEVKTKDWLFPMLVTIVPQSESADDDE